MLLLKELTPRTSALTWQPRPQQGWLKDNIIGSDLFDQCWPSSQSWTRGMEVLCHTKALNNFKIIHLFLFMSIAVLVNMSVYQIHVDAHRGHKEHWVFWNLSH